MNENAQKHWLAKGRLFFFLLLGIAGAASAAPFNRQMSFTQPNGTKISFWGKGDEFYATFTCDGYSILYDEARRAYLYAKCNEAGTALEATDAVVGVDAVPENLEKNEEGKIAADARAAARKARYDRWDAETGMSVRWETLKKAHRATLPLKKSGRFRPFAVSPVTGEKVGLTILVDFPDCEADPAIDSQEMTQLLNGESYTNFGNASSVRSYYLDNSNTNLDYSNEVIPYLRLPREKSYYNGMSSKVAIQAFVGDILDVLRAKMAADAEFNAEMLEKFSRLTLTEEGGFLRCLNILYAGEPDVGWGAGLWPCSGSLGMDDPLLPVMDIPLNRFQMSNIGETPEIYTICHENGHMLCDFPDFYDYDYDSTGGAGLFCLMSSYTDQKNPQIISAYLRYVSGWTTVRELNKYQSIIGELQSSANGWEAQNTIYRFPNPASIKDGEATEYYLLENRQAEGRDAQLPASGIAIWHVDELGNRDDQRYAYNDKHQNYECTLMQADGVWHFEKKLNDGDENDLWYEENSAELYTNQFTVASHPSSRWWNGSVSGLSITNFSVNGTTMYFHQRGIEPKIAHSTNLLTGRVGSPYADMLGAVDCDGTLSWTMESGTLPAGLSFDPVSSAITGLPREAGTFTLSFKVTTQWNLSATGVYTMTILEPYALPFTESFSNATPDSAWGWYQEPGTDAGNENTTAELAWSFVNGNGINPGYPAKAFSSPYNIAFLSDKTFTSVIQDEMPGEEGNDPVIVAVTNVLTPQKMLVSPMMDFSGARQASVSFRYVNNRKTSSQQDVLRVYYRTDYADSDWVLAAVFTNSVIKWTAATVMLPVNDLSATTYIGFEGTYNKGYGIHLDDVTIGDPTTPLAITNSSLPDATVSVAYQASVLVSGGVQPYTWQCSETLPAGISFADGVFSGVPTAEQTRTVNVTVTDAFGESVSRSFNLVVDLPYTTLYQESFDHSSGDMPMDWTLDFVTNSVVWRTASMDNLNGHPSLPYEGIYCALLYWSGIGVSERPDHITRLVSPRLYFGQNPHKLAMSFWLCMCRMPDTYDQYNQDTLKVYFRQNAEDAWGEPLAVYTNSVEVWTQQKVLLPNVTSGYICFEGNAKYGYGVCLDDIRVSDASFSPVIRTETPLPDALATVPYAQQLAAVGGTAPYTWALATGSTLPAGLSLAEDGLLSGTISRVGRYSFTVTVSDADGNVSSLEATLTVRAGIRADAFVGTFDTGMVWDAWSMVINNSATNNWVFQNGSSSRSGRSPIPAAAYAGGTNACLFRDSTYSANATLTTPMLNLEGMTNASISFWLCKSQYSTYKDELYLEYQTDYASTPVEIAAIKTNVQDWALYTFSLPNPTATYFIRFRGKTNGGYGICLDEVRLGGAYTNDSLTVYEQWKKDHGVDGVPDEADTDGDGLTNLEEFVFGSDPRTADAEAGLLDGFLEGSRFLVSYREGKEAREYGVEYRLESTTNLLDISSWSPTGIVFERESNSNTWWQVIYCHENDDVGVDPHRFFRLKVFLPEF